MEESMAKILKEVVGDTNLPEGVSVVHPREVETAKKPFVVVTITPSVDGAIKSFSAGALKYVEMTFNKEELKKKLSVG